MRWSRDFDAIKSRATAVEITDERIVAWDAIAQHPFFRECYATEDTLLNAMLAKLTDVTAQLQAAQAAISKALDRLYEPVHPYGDGTIPKVPEIDFVRDAYGDIADDIKVILSRADTSVLAEHDKRVAAEALEELADNEAAWASRAWRSEEAETVVKMRKAILARAAKYRASGTES